MKEQSFHHSSNIPVSLKKDIKNNLLTYLYDIPTKHYNKKLDAIISKNEYIQEMTLRGIFYKHRKFLKSVALSGLHFNENTYKISQADPSTEAELDKYIEDTFQLDQEKQTITMFLTILLNIVLDQEDFRYLVGDNLYLQGGGDTLPSELYYKPSNIDEFKIEYQEYLDTLNQRLVENLLMQDIYNDN